MLLLLDWFHITTISSSQMMNSANAIVKYILLSRTGGNATDLRNSVMMIIMSIVICRSITTRQSHNGQYKHQGYHT